MKTSHSHQNKFENNAPSRSALFLHIPKTAGMSLYYVLEAAYGKQHALRFPRSTEEYKQNFLDMPGPELDRFRLLSGHLDLPTFLSRNMKGRVIFAMLREPVERVLSDYGYIAGWKDHPLHNSIGQMSLEEYVEFQEAESNRNRQCRMLCGHADFIEAKRWVLEHVNLLGAVESMNIFLAALGELLETQLTIGKENQTKIVRTKRDDITSSLCSRLLNANIEDYKLWAWVIENNLIRGSPH